MSRRDPGEALLALHAAGSPLHRRRRCPTRQVAARWDFHPSSFSLFLLEHPGQLDRGVPRRRRPGSGSVGDVGLAKNGPKYSRTRLIGNSSLYLLIPTLGGVRGLTVVHTAKATLTRPLHGSALLDEVPQTERAEQPGTDVRKILGMDEQIVGSETVTLPIIRGRSET